MDGLVPPARRLQASPSLYGPIFSQFTGYSCRLPLLHTAPSFPNSPDIIEALNRPAAMFPFDHAGEDMGSRRLTLREALASDQLDDFVRQEEARGVELAKGSDLERALALLTTQRRSKDRSSGSLQE